MRYGQKWMGKHQQDQNDQQMQKEKYETYLI